MPDIINEYSFKLMNSFLLTVVFFGGYLLCKFLLTRKVKIKKLRSQYISRFKYFFFILFMIFFIKIWVEGFIQILTFIGFVSAAIVLTQKENLLNIVGWLIINWRGLFSEDDYIRISNFNGRVKSIGFMYFTLIEASPDFPESLNGGDIKIPNGMVSRNPILNFSQDRFVECTASYIFKPKVSLKRLEALFLVLKQEMQAYLKLQNTLENKAFSEDYEPKYLIKIRQEKPAGYEMVFLFYCKYVERATIQYKLNKLIIEFTEQDPDLTLAFD